MEGKRQSGFSLIELLLVVVMISIISTIAFPLLMRAKYAAENGNAYASMRTIHSMQIAFRSQNGRFGRLTEINALNNGNLGTVRGTDLIRGSFTFQMSPDPNPTDEQLKELYKIVATKEVTARGFPYIVEVDQTGYIEETFP